MAGSPIRPQGVQVHGTWIEDLNVPIHFSNAFMVSPMNNEFLLTFACAIPPVIAPGMSPDEMQALKFPIKPLVRVGMTPDRVVELIQLLQAQLSAYSKTIKS